MSAIASPLEEAVLELAEWAHAVGEGRATVPASTGSALDRVLANLLAVTVGAAASAAQRGLVAAWRPEPGAATLFGTGLRVPVETAAWLNGVAAVAMERDEGHKESKGHPAAQSFPAVLALAEGLGSSGPRTRRALLVAYEVGARLGRATDFAPDVHTHGTFGVAGAAAGCAVLLGLDASGIRTAIDAGCALPVSTSWAPVLAGSAVRDQWIGAGNTAGIAAARFAAVRPHERVSGLEPALGGRLGTVDAETLVRGLDEGEWLIESGYLKRYSACAYTHGPADAALHARSLLASSGRSLDDVQAVELVVTGKAAELTATTWTTRHGAYFSVPFAVASALVHGDVDHSRSDPDHAAALLPIASVVDVRAASDTDGPLFAETGRPARLTLRLHDAPPITVDVGHPLGDSTLTPFTPSAVDGLLDAALVEVERFDRHDVLAVVEALRLERPAGAALAALA